MALFRAAGRQIRALMANRFAHRSGGRTGAWLTGPALLLLSTIGCQTAGQRVQLVRANDQLRVENRRLQKNIDQRDSAIVALEHQVDTLAAMGDDRPWDLFTPVRVEIASRSGGADYDGLPGDDGVTAYVRPRDADGDIVKAPGRISIQLIDNTDLNAPRVLALCTFDDPQILRQAWHGRFATDHYTLQCPFPEESLPLVPQRVTVSAIFVDFLTGKTLADVKVVSISTPRP